MSSAISIKRPAEGKSRGKTGGENAAAEAGFRISHFFVLLSLMAATLAVLMSPGSRPESLILMSLTIGAAGAAGLGFYRMLAPLAATDSELMTEPLSERVREDLEREKTLVLRSIKELEFDRAMGKLSTQDFDEMAGRLRARAVGIIRQLDAGVSGYRSLIEKELAARISAAPRGTRAPDPKAASPERTEAKVATPGACVCGVRNDADARFCKACGSAL